MLREAIAASSLAASVLCLALGTAWALRDRGGWEEAYLAGSALAAIGAALVLVEELTKKKEQ